MTSPAILALLILALAILALTSGRLRPDLVAILVILGLSISGLLTPQEAISGFASPAVVALASIFVLTAGLANTGVGEAVALRFFLMSGKSERRLLLLVCLAVGFLSLFMNSIAAVAILLPAVALLSRRAGVNLSKLLIPLSFGSLLGGMATLFTTPNLLVSEILKTQGERPFSLLDFLPVGIPATALGIGFLVIWAPRILPERARDEKLPPLLRRRGEWSELYRLRERILELRVLPGSPLAKKTIADAKLGKILGVTLLGIIRNHRTILAPAKGEVLREGDRLLVEGKVDDLQELAPIQKLEIEGEVAERDLESGEIGVVETVLSPRSTLVGKSLREIDFREKYGLTVLALWRGGTPRRTQIAEIPLQLGDALLLQGRWEKLRVLARDPDFLVVGQSLVPLRREKAPLASGILLFSLALVFFNFLPLPLAMLLGASLLILSGCLRMEEAYQAIDWRTILVVAGLLPLGIAIEKSGAIDLIIPALGFFSSGNPHLVLAGVFFLTILLAQGIGSAATAVLLAPLAISAADWLGVAPHGMLMAVALASSFGFLTPISHPANLLVMGPGNYRFRDYARVGFPLTIVVSIVILALIPIFWPLK